MRSTNYNVFADSLSALLANGKPPAARHFMADVEAQADGFALVVRSEDKAVIGKTDAPSRCKFHFNDRAGKHVPFVIMTSADRSVLDEAAAQLITFYSTPGTFAERFANLGAAARSAFAIVSPVFGLERRDTSGRKVGAFRSIVPDPKVEIQREARALNNFNALSDAVANAAGEIQPPEIIMRVAEILRQIRAPKQFVEV